MESDKRSRLRGKIALFMHRNTESGRRITNHTTSHTTLVDTAKPIATTTANATNPLLTLPTELLFHLLTHLTQIDTIILSWTCHRLRSITPPVNQPLLPRSAIRDLRLITQRERFFRLLASLTSSPDPATALCWSCKDTHPVACFFPEQLQMEPTERACKKDGVLRVPGIKALTWLEAKALIGTPDTTGRAWNASVNTIRAGGRSGQLVVTGYTIRRSLGRIRGRVWGLRGRRLPTLHPWMCMLEIVYEYLGISEVDFGELGSLGGKVRGFERVKVCAHVGSDGDEVVGLVRGLGSVNGGSERSRGRMALVSAQGSCSECGTRFRLELNRWVRGGQLTLKVEKDIGRLDTKDPFKNALWLAHVEPPAKVKSRTKDVEGDKIGKRRKHRRKLRVMN